jgi:mono/diheme cytochrome c family protein
MSKFLLGLAIGLSIFPLGALIAAKSGFFPTDATSEPPAWEKTFAGMAFDASVTRHAPRVANPVQANDQETLAGMKIYRNACAGCHGDAHQPSDWGVNDFYPRVPQFAQEPPRKPDWQMFWIVKHGIRYSGMGAWDKQISDKEIWEAVTFLSRLNSLSPAVAEEWHKKQQP